MKTTLKTNLNRVIILLLCITFLLLFAACDQSGLPESTDNPSDTQNSVSDSETEKQPADTHFCGTPHLPDLLSGKTVLFSTQAKLKNGKEAEILVVVADNYTSQSKCNVHLYAEISGAEQYHKIGNFDSRSVEHCKLIAFDIDGDTTDEIILNMEITGNGGTVTYVYSLADGSFKLLYDLEDYEPRFECENKPDRKVEIKSNNPEFSYSIALADIFGEDIDNLAFDADGVMQEIMFPNTDPICDIAIENGEIVCTMPFEIDPTLYCFDIKQKFRYDTASRTLVVTGYEFAPINSSNNTGEAVPVPTEYEDAIDDYKRLVTYLFSEECVEDLNNGEFNIPEAVTVDDELSNDWFCMAADAKQGIYNASPESFGYALYDFDGDGVDELILLREDYFVMAIYTIESGESKLLDAYRYKHRAILLENGQIYNRISDGAVDFQIRLLEVCEQKLVTTSEFGYKQEYDRFYPYKMVDGTAKEITEDEFDRLNADYVGIYEDDSIKSTVTKLGIEFVSIYPAE